MKPKHHLILYTFLGFAALIALLLAVDYGTRAERSAQALEDTYTQHVLKAQEQLQSISLKLAKAPVADSPAMQVELLSLVSRQADGVVSDLTSLPLSHVAMSDTIKFCNQLSDYTLGLSLLCAGGSSLSETDVQHLNELKNHCSLLLGQFATARNAMLDESLRMTDQKDVFYQAAQLSARPLEQVADPDNGMDYPAMIYDGAFSDARQTRVPKALGSHQIDQAAAIRLARIFVGEERVRSAEAGVPTGGIFPCFGVVLTLTDGVILNADVTRQGGQILWMMPEHADFEPRLTLDECTRSALHFLQNRGYGDLEAADYQVYDGLAVISFVPLQDRILLYPDLIKVQVRMDVGDVVGMECSSYLMNHTVRNLSSPAISQERVISLVSPHLRVTSTRLCLIPHKLSERFCWEVVGLYNDDEYRVYLDAYTGEEIDLHMTLQTPESLLHQGSRAMPRTRYRGRCPEGPTAFA